ncbi:MAG TPA: excalibur calcium-binding domain-containing protein [Steroidobacteraceae bacterium]|nr:excalibur calcium-binding domain-containing protein [Steroidobacteraceae bacterium]
MKKVLLGVVIGALGVSAWNHIQRGEVAESSTEEMTVDASEPEVVSNSREAPSYSCDGRIYCSQMTSCEEARYFLANCPGVKMDGGGDGVPCESQWCGPH